MRPAPATPRAPHLQTSPTRCIYCVVEALQAALAVLTRQNLEWDERRLGMCPDTHGRKALSSGTLQDVVNDLPAGHVAYEARQVVSAGSWECAGVPDEASI